jgi:hypothetical protein
MARHESPLVQNPTSLLPRPRQKSCRVGCVRDPHSPQPPRRPDQSSPPNDVPPRVPARSKPYKFTSAIASKELYGWPRPRATKPAVLPVDRTSHLHQTMARHESPLVQNPTSLLPRSRQKSCRVGRVCDPHSPQFPPVDRTSHLHRTMSRHEFPLDQNPTSLLPRSRQKSCRVGRVREPHSPQPSPSIGPVISTKWWPATSPHSFKTLQVYFRDRVKRVVWLAASAIHTARRPPGVDRTSHLHQTMARYESPLVQNPTSLLPRSRQKSCRVGRVRDPHSPQSPRGRSDQSSPPNDGPPRVPARLKPYKFTSAIASKELYGWPRLRSTQPAVPPGSIGPVISTKRWPATSPHSFKTLQVYFRDRVKRVVGLAASKSHTARSPPGVDRTSHLHQTMACHESPLVQNPTSLLPRSRQKSCRVGRVRELHSPQSSPSTGPVISTKRCPATSSRSFKTLQVYFRDRVKRVVWLVASSIHTARSPPGVDRTSHLHQTMACHESPLV